MKTLIVIFACIFATAYAGVIWGNDGSWDDGRWDGDDGGWDNGRWDDGRWDDGRLDGRWDNGDDGDDGRWDDGRWDDGSWDDGSLSGHYSNAVVGNGAISVGAAGPIRNDVGHGVAIVGPPTATVKIVGPGRTGKIVASGLWGVGGKHW